MPFTGDLNTDKGLKEFNAYLSDKSYVEGYTPSDKDFKLVDTLKKAPQQSFMHVLRWYNHIKSFTPEERKTLGGGTSVPANKAGAKPTTKKEEDDDDLDLFGSDGEDNAEADKVREERLKAYNEKKSKKPALIAKSSIVLDVKPYGDETDMKQMEESVRTIVKDGLVWGASKLVPVGYGINKLQIMCVVEDEKISVDELVEDIEKFEDFVQSVDIAAFNKI